MASKEFPQWQIAQNLKPGESFHNKETNTLYLNPKVGGCQEETHKLHYESDRMFHRYPCTECGKDNVYTRCYINKASWQSGYYCYNCAADLDPSKGWELATASVRQNLK